MNDCEWLRCWELKVGARRNLFRASETVFPTPSTPSSSPARRDTWLARAAHVAAKCSPPFGRHSTKSTQRFSQARGVRRPRSIPLGGTWVLDIGHVAGTLAVIYNSGDTSIVQCFVDCLPSEQFGLRRRRRRTLLSFLLKITAQDCEFVLVGRRFCKSA